MPATNPLRYSSSSHVVKPNSQAWVTDDECVSVVYKCYDIYSNIRINNNTIKVL